MRRDPNPFGLGSDAPTLAALLTLRCSQRCPHCFVTQDPDKYGAAAGPELPGTAWTAFFEKVPSPHKVILTGGEPTLHADFLEILRSLPDRHLRIVATNLKAEEELFETILASGAAVVAGFHEHLPEARKDAFIEKARRLSRLGPLVVQYIAHLDDEGDSLVVARKLRKARLRFQIVPIVDMDATGFHRVNRRLLAVGKGRDHYIRPRFARALERAAGGAAHIDTSAIERIVGHPEFFLAPRPRRARCDILARHTVVGPTGEIFACRIRVGKVTQDDPESWAGTVECPHYGRCAELCVDPATLNVLPLEERGDE